MQTHRRDHDWPPDVLIDRGHSRAVHRALREAAPGLSAGAKEVGVAIAIAHRAQHVLADQPACKRRHPRRIGLCLHPRPSSGHTGVTHSALGWFTVGLESLIESRRRDR
jgi:hypothetical protein